MCGKGTSPPRNETLYGLIWGPRGGISRQQAGNEGVRITSAAGTSPLFCRGGPSASSFRFLGCARRQPEAGPDLFNLFLRPIRRQCASLVVKSEIGPRSRKMGRDPGGRREISKPVLTSPRRPIQGSLKSGCLPNRRLLLLQPWGDIRSSFIGLGPSAEKRLEALVLRNLGKLINPGPVFLGRLHI